MRAVAPQRRAGRAAAAAPRPGTVHTTRPRSSARRPCRGSAASELTPWPSEHRQRARGVRRAAGVRGARRARRACGWPTAPRRRRSAARSGTAPASETRIGSRRRLTARKGRGGRVLSAQRGGSSVGRARASQARGRGFETRSPLACDGALAFALSRIEAGRRCSCDDPQSRRRHPHRTPNGPAEPAAANAEWLAWTTYESPIGQLTLIVARAAIRELRFPPLGRSRRTPSGGACPRRSTSSPATSPASARTFELEPRSARRPPAAGRLGAAAADSLRRDDVVRRARTAHRRFAVSARPGALPSGAAGRRGDRPHADADPRAVPSRDRRRRLADRLWRRPATQARAARAGGRPRARRCRSRQQLRRASWRCCEPRSRAGRRHERRVDGAHGSNG